MKRVVVIAVLVAAAALVAWQFPLFHIVPIDSAAAENAQSPFNAAKFAEVFWREQLVPSLEKAANAEELLALLRANPQQARDNFGRSPGVSRQSLYVVRAQGTIVSVKKGAVSVALGDADEADVVLQTGPLFGNVIRDATGLIRPGDFANSQQFNDISAELNRIVETRVIAPLQRDAKVGRRVNVVGCAEQSNNNADIKPLLIIPLQVRFE